MSASRDGASRRKPAPPPKKKARISPDESLAVDMLNSSKDDSKLEDLADAENSETRESHKTATWTTEQLQYVIDSCRSPSRPGCSPLSHSFEFPSC
jgi:hypothetical protein